MTNQDQLTSLRQQVETLKQDVSIWKASSEKWAQRHAEVHAQNQDLTQQLASLAAAQERMTAEIEDFTGWWWLNREGSVNRTYDYIDKLVKRLVVALPSLAASSRETTDETKE